MFRNKLTFKFMLVLVAFSFIVIVPLFFTIDAELDTLMSSLDKAMILTPEHKLLHEKFNEQVLDNFIAVIFYTFVLSLITAIFLARKFLKSIKELERGAEAVMAGDLDVRLAMPQEESLAIVTKTFNDMSDALRKKTEEMRKKDLYINTMLDPLWVADKDNIIIDVNPAFTRLLGYSREDAVGASLFDFMDEENERIMRAQLQKRDSGQASTYSISIISKNEGNMPVLISGVPIEEGGEIVARLGIMKDFRSEMALRDALKEERDHTEAIMDSLADTLVVIDRDMRLVKANKTAISKAGADITGKFCHEVFHGVTEACFIHGIDCPVKAVFETGKTYRTVHKHIEAFNAQVFYEITAYPVKNADGSIMHVVELMKDVTDKKKYEDEIAQKNKELTTLNSISKVLSQSLKSEDIFNNVIEKMIDMLDMDGGGIYFLDEMGRELICKYQRGVSDEFMRTAGKIRVGEDIPGRVAVTGQGIVTHDIFKDSRIDKSILKHSGIRSLACMPIKGKEKLIGVFYVFSFGPHIFTFEEERILNSIGEMTGISFENIKLYEKMRSMYEIQRKRRSDEQKSMLKLTSSLAGTLEIDETLASILQTLRDSGRADFVWLLKLDGEGNLVLADSTRENTVKGEIIYALNTSSMEKYAIEKKKPIIFTELSSETRFFVHEHALGYNTACSIPIFVGDKMLGAISLFSRSYTVFGEEDIYFLQIVAGVLAVAFERSRLYEEVIAEKGMADTVLESISDGIITIDLTGRIIAINRAAKVLIDIGDESVGARCCDLFEYTRHNLQLRSALVDCLDDAYAGRMSSRDSEIHILGKAVIPLKVNSSPIFDTAGVVTGAVFVLRDVSREREIDRMRTEFVKAVSEEFRVPLSAIVGMTEMIIDSEVGRETELEYLNTVYAEGKRLSDLVTDLLNVARIESGKEVFRDTEIDFASMLNDISLEFEQVKQKKELLFSFIIDEEILGFRGDKEKLTQMLRNLVDNAVTYSDSGKKVEIEATADSGMVKLSVRDEGWGIAVEDQQHVGEKFYRGVHASATKGTGLGLSLCRAIAALHGGEMRIESVPGKGTTVTVELPLRRVG